MMLQPCEHFGIFSPFLSYAFVECREMSETSSLFRLVAV